jgi:hypothetical protein
VKGVESDRVAGAVVTLVPDGERVGRQDLYRRTATDEGGQFLLTDVPPGVYRLFAWARIPENAEYDRNFLQPYISQSRFLRVLENGVENAEVTLISPAF